METRQSALMLAAQHNNVELAQLLIPYEVNVRDVEQKTALMYAALNNSTDVIPLLL